MNKLILMFLVCCMPTALFAGDAEKIIWDKKPIAITLPIGQERLVIFPSDVRVQVPRAVRHMLRTISNDGVVYWRANAPFDVERIKVQLIESGQIVMIDLAASEKRTKTSDIEILISSSEKQASPSSQAVASTSLDYVGLTRFAAQSLYAPERLITQPFGVTRTQLDAQSTDKLIRGEIIQATPMISWQSNGLFITAVKLTNLTTNKLVLDPRDIRGRWEAATFQHVHLGPSGTTEDTTSVYLVSKRPYEESL